MPKINEKKVKRWNELQDAVNAHNKILFVDADNVTSQQIIEIRKSLRAVKAKMVMGKNTLMRKSLLELSDAKPHVALIRDQLKGNTGMIFTNGDEYEIKDILDANNRGASAKIG